MSLSDTIDGIFREYDNHKDDIKDVIVVLDDIGILNKDSVDNAVNNASNSMAKNIAPNLAKQYAPYLIVGGIIIGGILYLMLSKKG